MPQLGFIQMTYGAKPSATKHVAFRAPAKDLPGIDREACATLGRDWRDPIIGLGPRDARLCIFGRDPARTEVERALPFVGKGGQSMPRRCSGGSTRPSCSC